MPMMPDYLFGDGGAVSRVYRFDLLSYFVDIGYVVVYHSDDNKYVLPLIP
jgi:hypothetical protein